MGKDTLLDPPIFVDLDDIRYVNEEWLSQPYIDINDINQFYAQMDLESKRGLDLSLDNFTQSQFYARRKDPTGPDVLTNADLRAISTNPWGKVNRPNHGLGHTLRTVAYISEILKHLKNNSTYSVFQNMNEMDIKKIQYLALFSIVGRLNECGWAEDLITYSYFRWRSGEIFYHYMMQIVDGHPRYEKAGFRDEQELLYYKEQLMDMGEPTNKNPEHIILNITHKIDLMRCSHLDNKFSSRFDDYVREFLPQSSIEELKDLGQQMIINTGEHIKTGDHHYTKNVTDREREGSVFEDTELDIQKCLANIQKTFSPIKDKNLLPPFLAKASGAYQFNKNSFFDFMDDLIKEPHEFRHPKYRSIPRNPQHFTIKGRSVSRIGDKISEYRSDEKLNYSHITSGTYIDTESKTPVFGHAKFSWRYLVGIGIDPKDAAINRLIRRDIGTFKRTLDFKTKTEAEKEIQEYEDVARTFFYPNEFDQFKLAIQEDAFKNIHNEVMARFRWNCDGSSKIYIFADTLEARLTAYQFKRYLQSRLGKTQSALNYFSGYEVPIQFYTPYHPRNGQPYSTKDYESDLKEVFAIYSDEKKRKAHYAEENYFFLLGLDKNLLPDALQEIIDGVPLWLKMITTGNNHLLEQLLLKINAYDELEKSITMLDPNLNNLITDQLIKEMAEFGYSETLRLIYDTDFKSTDILSEFDTLIEIAIEKGRPQIVNLLRSLIIPIDVKAEIDRYLTLAIKHRQLTAFQYLLDEAEPLDQKYLIEAIQAGDIRMVEILHARNLNFYEPDSNGVTPLHHAAASGKNAIIRLILQNTDLQDLDIQDNFGKTPLHYAAENGQDHTMEFLINLNSNIDFKDNDNQSPLHYALTMKHTNVVEMLLAANADISDIVDSLPLTTTEICKLILERKALLEGNSKPLSYNDPKIKKILVKSVVDLGDIIPGSPYQPLGLVTKISRLTAILQYTDFNSASPSGEKTLLHYAAKQGQTAMLINLLALKAININTQDEQGNTALHYAIEKKDIFAVNRLLADGCEINMANNNGKTPLHYAVENGNDINIFLSLIGNGANPHAKDADGLTPLQAAKKVFSSNIAFKIIEKKIELLTKIDNAVLKKIESLDDQKVKDNFTHFERALLQEFSNNLYVFIKSYYTSMPEKLNHLEQLENLLILNLIKEKYIGSRKNDHPSLNKLVASLIDDFEITIDANSNLDKLLEENKMQKHQKSSLFHQLGRNKERLVNERATALSLIKEYTDPNSDSSKKNIIREKLLSLLLMPASLKEDKPEQDISRRFNPS